MAVRFLPTALVRTKMEKTIDKLNEVLDLIRGSRTILITSHRDPDGDSIGSQLALAHLVEKWGKSCRIINQGELPFKYGFLDPSSKIENVEVMESRKGAGADPDLAFVLDCTSMSRVGDVERIIPPQTSLVNIDHHQDNELFGTFNHVDVSASAVGETIFSLLEAAAVPLTPEVANQLYAAILTDTGRFKFTNTTPRCLNVCAELIEKGADPRYVTNQIYFNHSLAFLKLLGSVLRHPEITGRERICSMIISQRTLRDLKVNPKELEGLVNYSLFLKGVEIGLLFTEKEDGKTKVNLRSQNEFNVAKVAKAFGGGGHRNAAGCMLDLSLNEAKKIIVGQIQRMLKDEPVGSVDS